MCVRYEISYLVDIVNVSKFVSHIKPLRTVASQTSERSRDSGTL